ncbi:MAG: DUF262 domain-containing protein [Calditrichaeota bacterium]|nr:MAG: DUF262 domain-containing protein [Calditrichota bacterium]
MNKSLRRRSNTINIATFWEDYNLKKYNLSPNYQRKNKVWNISEQSYLIDTILKNFPMPPIFLHQHINNDGRTMYDVIDGKQRLSAIIRFIDNQIAIPDDFHSDKFGDERLSGLFFKDLDKESFIGWKVNFWKYELTIEYIETDQIQTVNNIFDRLNRNGEPLTKQELRNAKFNNTYFHMKIIDFTNSSILKDVLDKTGRNRMEDQEFISELLFFTVNELPLPGDNPKTIDKLYEEYCSKTKSEIDSIFTQFEIVLNIYSKFKINLKKYHVYGVSHIYGIWGLAIHFSKLNAVPKNISIILNNFYQRYRDKEPEPNIDKYRESMSAGTKSKKRRSIRVNALIKYVKKEFLSK